jgi:diguanylate cyclase (GGDEF)-like protein/PAS domain S-box-containing protein
VPLLAALVAVALLAGVGLVASEASERTVRDEAQDRVRSNRDAAVRALEHQTGDYRRTVAAFADSPAVAAALTRRTPSAMAALQASLHTLASGKRAPTAFASDPGGRALAIYPPTPALIGQDFSFRDWYQGVRRTRTAYVSSAYRSAIAGKPLVVAVAAPVRSGARTVGYLTVTWELSSVRAVAEGAQRDDGVMITVADQNGLRLTNEIAVDQRGQPVASSATAVTGPRGDFVSRSSPIPGLGWTVEAVQPSSTALAAAAAFRRSLGLTLGIALLLVLVGAALAVRFGLRRASEQSAVDVERRRLEALFAASPVGIMESGPDRVIVAVNDALASMLGYDAAELIGVNAADLVVGGAPEVDDVVAGRLAAYTRDRVYRSKSGTLVPALVSVIAARSAAGEVVDVIAFVVDQREQQAALVALQAAEQQLRQLALHDELTGLPNRRLLLERLSHALTVARAGRSGSTVVALLFLDLDGFKPVNDSLGHAAGDQLLCDVALALCIAVRPTDTVARVGGDEFVVLLDSGGGAAADVAARLTSVVRRDLPVPGGYLSVSASVGVASADLSVEPGVSAEQLLARADAAMYRAKDAGRDRYEV